MNFLKKYYNLLINPENFPFGKEVEETKIIHNKNPKTFVKKYRKNKIDKYIKLIFLSNKLKDCNFIPKLVNYNDDTLEVEQIYCGKQAKIRDLPTDWKQQIISIKKDLMKHKIAFIDWGPWDVNPYIINNICIHNQKIYLIDLGDCYYDEPKNIEKYFDLQIYYFEKLVEKNRLFLFYHYINCIYKGIYRKLSRPYNWVLLIILFIIYYL